MARPPAVVYTPPPHPAFPAGLGLTDGAIMTAMLVILHVVVCVFLTLVVLLQQGKQGMGSAFGGGGSGTVFGGRGANTFLAKLTAAAAMLFMVTSLSLSYLSSKSGSALEDEPDEPAAAKVDAPKDAKTDVKTDARPAEGAKPAEGAAAPEAAKPAEGAAAPEAAKPEPAKPAQNP